MLRMRPEERLSAGGFFTKRCDLKLFDGHSSDSERVTPTRQTALQGGINDDDGSTTIVLGALSEHISGLLKSRKRQRSPAVGSARNSSDRDQIKRRPSEIHSSMNMLILYLCSGGIISKWMILWRWMIKTEDVEEKHKKKVCLNWTNTNNKIVFFGIV